MINHKCKVCGKPLHYGYKVRRYCPECRKRIISDYSKWVEKGNKEHLKKCIVCGKANHSRSYLVCGNHCSHILSAIVRQYWEQRGLVKSRRKPLKKQIDKSALSVIVQAAAHMSYGYYVAQQRRLR